MQTNKLPRGRKPAWILNLGQTFSYVSTFMPVAPVLVLSALKLQTMKIERKGKVNWRVTGD